MIAHRRHNKAKFSVYLSKAGGTQNNLCQLWEKHFTLHCIGWFICRLIGQFTFSKKWIYLPTYMPTNQTTYLPTGCLLQLSSLKFDDVPGHVEQNVGMIFVCNYKYIKKKCKIAKRSALSLSHQGAELLSFAYQIFFSQLVLCHNLCLVEINFVTICVL